MGKDGGRVIVSTVKDGCSVKVSVSDNGPGIPAENLKKVLEPFFTTKPVGKGTGLGLSVSYGIMRDLMGDIKIDSAAGEGTTVSLLLPAE
jgi:two-component system NtrC family sensor kinase